MDDGRLLAVNDAWVVLCGVKRAEVLPKREADGLMLLQGCAHDVTEICIAAQALKRQHRMLEPVRQPPSGLYEAEDKRHAFEGVLAALLNVIGSA